MRAKILNASAGSGKTYQLAYKYVRDVIDQPGLYRHILAVTFTNKATEEMKSRILKEIHRLASGGASPYLENLCRELSLDERSVRKRAAEVRSKILHDYSRFTVLTIDTFFQRILRAFIKELGIDLNYNVEIETASVLSKGADTLIEQITVDRDLQRWLTEFVQVPDTEAPKIVYDTKGSYTTKFRAEVKDKVLRITERSDARRPDRTSVTVYYNSLERVAIADAVATFDSTLVATVLDLTVGGMAQVTARMDVKDLKMELTGKSTATLTGAVRYLSLFVSTGKLEAAGLEVMAAEANVTSSGVAALWVTDRFQGKTSTGGKITYKGAPPIVRSGAKFMGGDITRVE